MTQLVVQHVRKEFQTQNAPLVVLNDVSLSMNSGESAAILGPSGSGKSTLLHIIGSLEPPTAGQVVLDDTELFGLDERQMAQFRNQSIGFIFQDHHLLPELSLLENVMIPALAEGELSSADREWAMELIERVGLTDRQSHRPGELSGGERGRAAIARALMQRPAILLADEPTGNLDHKTAAMVLEVLLQLQEQEQTMLMVVTHSLTVAAKMGSQFELVDGCLVDAKKASDVP
jgi:lipoprotein-releasing system ATP-binding protein